MRHTKPIDPTDFDDILNDPASKNATPAKAALAERLAFWPVPVDTRHHVWSTGR